MRSYLSPIKKVWGITPKLHDTFSWPASEPKAIDLLHIQTVPHLVRPGVVCVEQYKDLRRRLEFGWD